jgi:hypothetical protein
VADALPRVGKYRLLELLATGGMGEVFVAQPDDGGAETQVVVKRILRHLAADTDFLQMFLNEARIAAMLAHPNVVRILELGVDDGTYFMAMEYVRGCSVRALLHKVAARGEHVPAAVAAAICNQVLAGLHYAHTYRDSKRQVSGVIHRDVSPDNVLVGFNGVVKVADFGIAKALRPDDVTTRTRMLKGKLAYMAPEQLEGQPVDPRADIYSMGVVLYELMTGRRPFEAPTDALLVHRLLSGDRPRPPRELNPAISSELEAVMLRALARHPEDRFSSAQAMAEALAFLGTVDVGRHLEGLFAPGERAAPAPKATAGTVALSPVIPASELLTVAVSPTTVSPAPVAPPPPARKRIWVAAGVAALAAVTLALVSGRGGRGKAAQPEAPPAEAPVVAAVTPPPPPAPSPSAPVETPVHSEARAAKEKPPRPAKTGKVVFRVYPWAEVIYRGKSLGVTPLAPIETPAGPQTFTLRNNQLAQSKEVRISVPAGGVSVYKLDFFKP